MPIHLLLTYVTAIISPLTPSAVSMPPPPSQNFACFLDLIQKDELPPTLHSSQTSPPSPLKTRRSKSITEIICWLSGSSSRRIDPLPPPRRRRAASSHDNPFIHCFPRPPPPPAAISRPASAVVLCSFLLPSLFPTSCASSLALVGRDAEKKMMALHAAVVACMCVWYALARSLAPLLSSILIQFPCARRADHNKSS